MEMNPFLWVHGVFIMRDVTILPVLCNEGYAREILPKMALLKTMTRVR
jgi:hypothetical protein